MEIIDFSNGFDTLLSSYAHTALFGRPTSEADLAFDEYEKSLFLTKAQEEIALGLYTGKNTYGESFEQTEELRRYLSFLVTEAHLQPTGSTIDESVFDSTFDSSFHDYIIHLSGMGNQSKFFRLPSDLWFITYESVNTSNSSCGGAGSLEVLPVRQDEYNKIKGNPFRGANNRRALRLDLSGNTIEIVSKYNVVNYYIRYLKRLRPIILVELDKDGMSINGESQPRGSMLHEGLHQKILELAVRLAMESKGIGVKSQDNEQRK